MTKNKNVVSSQLIGYYNTHNPNKCPKSKGLVLWKQFLKTHFFWLEKFVYFLVLLHLFFKQIED